MKCFMLAISVATTLLSAVAGAQPNNPPLSVTVTNTPLPVSVVSLPPSSPTIVCKREIGSSASPLSQVAGGGGSGAFASPILKCPAGITAIDVKRIVVEPILSLNVTDYMATIKVGPPDPLNTSEISEPKLLAVVTNGAPEVSLADPVRLDVSPTSTLLLVNRLSCKSQISSGIECRYTLYLFGKAVQ